MAKIRVLLADDSVVVRRMVTDALSADPQIQVVGAAANGKIALAKIPQVNPEIIVLDVEMPEMDGLVTLEHIRKTYPSLPVIMYSTLTQRGAEATLDALAKGATDYVTKPSNVGSAAQALERIRTELIPKIKAICTRAIGVSLPSPVPTPLAPMPLHHDSHWPMPAPPGAAPGPALGHARLVCRDRDPPGS
jgi:two-component system chemotaxis response regulator CheB